MGPVFFAIAAIAAAVFWLLGIPKLRERRRRRRAAQPFPVQWRLWLEQHIGVYRRLPAPLRERLHGLTQVFVHEKAFVGCNGLEVSDRMRVVIAAQACLLVLNRPGVPHRTLYDELLSILVYPTPFIVPELRSHGGGLVSEEQHVLSGQAWDSRRILLSWEDVELPGGAGNNVVLHEFAHYLDMEDETMDGAPGLGSKDAYQQWSRVFWEEYDRLRHDLQAGVPTLLNPYAATAPAEFFAVVTEVFFEQPRELEAQHQALYQQLQKYYRLDPARWDVAA